MLVSALSDDREDVRDMAEDMLVHLAPGSVPRLLEELEHGRAPCRAASTLGASNAPFDAVRALVDALERPDPQLRAACCAALGDLRHPDAVEPLLRATRDREYAVRAQAGRALDKIGTVAVVMGVAALVKPIESRAELRSITGAEHPGSLGQQNGATDGGWRGARRLLAARRRSD